VKHKVGDFLWIVGSGTRPVDLPWIARIIRVDHPCNSPSVYVVESISPRPGETMGSCWNEWQVRSASLLEALAEAAQ